mgnify:CR=1 FL=1
MWRSRCRAGTPWSLKSFWVLWMPFRNGRHFSRVAFCRSMVSVMSGSRMGGGCVNKAGIPGRALESDGFMAEVIGIDEVGRLGFCACGNRTFRFPSGIGDLRNL